MICIFDCHVHTNFSSDSKMSLEAAVNKAIEIGLDGIAVTDHLDYGFPGYSEIFMVDFDEYFKKLNLYQKKYDNKIKLIKGIEAGLQPHVLKETATTLASYSFDYIIASIHIINGKDPYSGGFYEELTKSLAYTAYLQQIESIIDGFDTFDVLGHIDYVTRYAPFDDKCLYYKDYCDLFDSILKKLITKGKGLELNTRYYKGLHTDLDIYKRYKELGGEIISLGSDAHSIEGIGARIDYFTEQLKKIGFKYITHYIERKPVFVSI